MKKLLLLAAFGLLASPAFAQNNSSTVNQSGNTQAATVAQAGQSHSSLVEQSDARNTAGVTQDGARHTSEVSQSSTDNNATVSQSGTPAGDGHYSLVSQSGVDNQISVSQSTGSPYNPTDVASYAYQSGDGNEATVLQQVQQDQYSYLEQSGEGNKAKVHQSASAGSESFVYQTASEGEVDVYQRAGGHNYSFVDQVTGSGNYAKVSQDNEVLGNPVVPQYAHSYITQSGTDNSADVRQSLRVNAESHVDQNGTDNMAKVLQYNAEIVDPAHYSSIAQTGVSHLAEVEQFGATSERSQSRITQGAGSADTFLKAFVTQEGDGHMSTVAQMGNNNTATVTQN